MSKKRKAAGILRRRPRSWLGIACAVFSLGSLAFTAYDADTDGKLTNRAQIFEAFAELNVDMATVARMQASPVPARAKPFQARWHTIVQVLDGDTVRLDNGKTVRLLGVDTPESSENRKLREDVYKTGNTVRESDLIELGKLATVFAKSLAEGRRCWLEHEKQPTDNYGRLLAYIHLEDGRILNEELLAQGYAKAYLNQPFRYKKRYILLQIQASAGGRGLWGDTAKTAGPLWTSISEWLGRVPHVGPWLSSDPVQAYR